jgi:hypothetical protein
VLQRTIKTTLTIRLDESMVRALEAAAERSGCTKSEVVRDLIRRRLRADDGAARDGWKQYAGIGEGPPDLSTNKAHLEGLGRRRR